MSLNAATIESAVAVTVKAEFITEFGGASPPATEDAIATAIANVIAKVVPDIIAAIKTDADLTGVTSGSDTVLGGVD